MGSILVTRCLKFGAGYLKTDVRSSKTVVRKHVLDSQKRVLDARKHVPDAQKQVLNARKHVPDARKYVSDARKQVLDARKYIL